MSRMTTSRASLSWASAAIRRACSSGRQAVRSVARLDVRVEPVAPDDLRHRGRHARRSTSSPRSSRARSSREATGVGSISKNATRSGRRELRQHRVEPLAREPGPGRDGEPDAPEHLLGLLPAGEVANSSAPIRKVAPSHSGCARSRSTVRAWLVEHDLVVREGCARELEPDRGRRRDPLVARVGRDEHDEPVEAERLLRRAAPARRGRGAAGRTRRRRARSVTRARTLRRRPRPSRPGGAGRLERALELLVARRRADDAEAALGAQEAPRPRLRLGPVDEEVGELVGVALGAARGSGTSVKSRAPELVDPVAGRAGEREDRARCARSSIPNTGLRARGRSCSGRRSAAARRARRRTPRARRRSCATARRTAATRRSRGRACARARGARGTRGRARRPRSRPRSAPGTSATTSWRPSGDSTVPSTGCERRERVVGDLRARVRDPREQRRLAGVRQPDERRVGEQLQVQLDVALLAGRPTSANRGTWRVDVTKRAFPRPPRPPRASTTRAPRMREVGDQVAAVGEDLRADRHAHLDVVAVGAVLPRAAAVPAAPGLDQRRRAGATRDRAAPGRRAVRRRRRRRRRRRPGRPWARTSRAGS